jgi:hypothetical protein
LHPWGERGGSIQAPHPRPRFLKSQLPAEYFSDRLLPIVHCAPMAWAGRDSAWQPVSNAPTSRLQHRPRSFSTERSGKIMAFLSRTIPVGSLLPASRPVHPVKSPIAPLLRGDCRGFSDPSSNRRSLRSYGVTVPWARRVEAGKICAVWWRGHARLRRSIKRTQG